MEAALSMSPGTRRQTKQTSTLHHCLQQRHCIIRLLTYDSQRVVT